MQEAIDLTIHPLLAWFDAHLRAPSAASPVLSTAGCTSQCAATLTSLLVQAAKQQSAFQAWLEREEAAGKLTFQVKP